MSIFNAFKAKNKFLKFLISKTRQIVFFAIVATPLFLGVFVFLSTNAETWTDSSIPAEVSYLTDTISVSCSESQSSDILQNETIQNQEHNLFGHLLGEPFPDLVSQDISIKGSLVDGTAITFAGIIKNQGGSEAMHSYARFCIDATNCLNDMAYTVDGTDHLISILQGDAFEGVVSDSNHPWVASVGEHTVYLCADVGGTVTESDEVNNCMGLLFSVTPKAPVADFTASPMSGTAPLIVGFMDLSTFSVDSLVSWTWDFNSDGTIDSTLQNPQYIYSIPGDYAAKLTVSSVDGSSTKTKTIMVTAALQPDLVIEDPSVFGEMVVNQPITLSGKVINIGSASAGDFTAVFKINDSEVGIQPVVSLAVNGTKDVSLTTWVPTAAGNYTFKLCADKNNAVSESNESNNCSIASTFTIGLQDITPPVISLVSPTGFLPSGTTETTFKITTNESATCKYSISSDVAYDLMSYFFNRDTTGISHSVLVKVTDGNSYTYFVRCQDQYGNHNETGFKVSFSVASATQPEIQIDKTPPHEAEIIFPLNGATVSGIVSVKVDAMDDIGISKIDFYLDNALLATDTTSPYSYALDTAKISNDSHSLYIVAYDTSGNFTTSNFVSVKVLNKDVTSPRILLGPEISYLTHNKAIVHWTTDEQADSQAEYGMTTSYGISTYLYTELKLSHFVTFSGPDLTGLMPNTTYYYGVRSRDAAGNLTTLSGFSFTTKPSPDATISGDIVDTGGNMLADFSGWVYAKTVTEPFQSFGGPVDKGAFSFSLPAGKYRVSVDLPPGANYSSSVAKEITVATGSYIDIQITLTPRDSTITGHLKLNGIIITGVPAKVFVSGENGATQSADIDTSTGAFILRVGVGTWYLNSFIDPATRYTVESSVDPIVVIYGGGTFTHDIHVIKNEAVIKGATRDSLGRSVVGALVSIDKESFSQSTSVGAPSVIPSFSVNGGKTDSNGNFEFSVPVPSGTSYVTYYIHAFLPPERGFINPEEAKIIVKSGEIKSIVLIFRSQDVIVSGRATINNNGTSAFVSAWSEKGGYAEARSDDAGQYVLRISKNDTWHLSAKKEMNNIVYRSDDLILAITSEATSFIRNFVLVKTSEILPSPVSVTTDVVKTALVVLEDGVRVSVPESAFGASGNATISVISTSEVYSGGITTVVGTAYSIEARDYAGKLITIFSKNISINFPYTNEKLKTLGINEDSLVPSYWDETFFVWKKTDKYVIDKTNKLVAVTTDHLTRFALIAPTVAAAPSSEVPAEETPAVEKQVTSAEQLNEGDLIRGPDGIKVYIINEHGYKRHIFNPAVFNMYGHLSWESIKKVSQTTLDLYEVSDLYRADVDPKVYSLEEIDEANGIAVKRWLDMTPERFLGIGYKWQQVFIVNEKERDYYRTGESLN